MCVQVYSGETKQINDWYRGGDLLFLLALLYHYGFTGAKSSLGIAGYRPCEICCTSLNVHIQISTIIQFAEMGATLVVV